MKNQSLKHMTTFYIVFDFGERKTSHNDDDDNKEEEDYT